MKIIAAARSALADGRTLPLVADEVGSPTYAPDLAGGILDLASDPASVGLHHVVNDGSASRATWARQVLADAHGAPPLLYRTARRTGRGCR